MVGYVTLGTSDLDRAVAFYDELLKLLGGKQIMNDGRIVIWAGEQMGVGMLAVCTPFDKNPASVGNGVMVALNMKTPEAVAQLHAKALELGATDEGAPGERMPGAHFGYFRDLDGNKIAGFCLGA